MKPVEHSPEAAVIALLHREAAPGQNLKGMMVNRRRITLVPLGQPPAPIYPLEKIEIKGALFTIDLETIVFGKQRPIDGRQVFAVSYEVTHNPALGGRRHTKGSVVVAELVETGGWWAFSGCGIGNGKRRDLTEPCVGFGYGWSAERGFTASARVFRGDADVSTVRLRSVDGLELDADTEDDLALFFAPQPIVRPSSIEIELCDRSGGVVARQSSERRRPDSPPRER